jgi:hypothetical protein
MLPEMDHVKRDHTRIFAKTIARSTRYCQRSEQKRKKTYPAQKTANGQLSFVETDCPSSVVRVSTPRYGNPVGFFAIQEILRLHLVEPVEFKWMLDGLEIVLDGIVQVVVALLAQIIFTDVENIPVRVQWYRNDFLADVAEGGLFH